MGIKGWAIRFVLGIVLGFGAGSVVEALHLGLAVFIFGSLDGFLNHKHRPEEEIWVLLGFNSMTAGAAATFVASWLSVLIAPVHYADRLVLRSWAMAATLGALIGAGLGGLSSLLHPRYLDLDQTVVLVLACGVLAGTSAATFLRLRVNR